MKGRLAALGAVVIWGFQFSVLASAMHHVDAYHFSSLRFILGALVLAGLLLWREGRTALRFDGRLGAVLFYGAAGFAAFSILLNVALGYTSPQNAALFVALAPLLTQLLRWGLDGVRPRPAILGLAVVALFGLFLVITRGHLDNLGHGGLGDLMSFVSVLGWALYTYGAGKFPGWSPLRFTTLTMIGGAIVTVAATAVADLVGAAHLPSLSDLGAVTPHLLYISLIGSVAAVLLWTVAVRALGASTAVLFMNLPPIIALIIAAVGGAKVEPVELLGAAITVGALLGANLVNRRAAQTAAPVVSTPRITETAPVR
ncbi:DMT family transporter [Hamadaea tsunoensis]|uniref:DMT family transporter n=1 Tax=Hamadaea tsunoensis TaxID=53368 RepID=UPI0004215034|nr:DMT family transporter [Hamadaea tsunoensis]